MLKFKKKMTMIYFRKHNGDSSFESDNIITLIYTQTLFYIHRTITEVITIIYIPFCYAELCKLIRFILKKNYIPRSNNVKNTSN